MIPDATARPTCDGEAVLLHDDTLDRTTDGRGPVAARTLASLNTLDAGAWHGPTFAGERIPTLDATIDLLRALRLDANVELEPCPGRARETGARVTALLRDRWPEGAAPLRSMGVEPSRLAHPRSTLAGVALGALAALATPTSPWWDRATVKKSRVRRTR